MKTNEIVNDVEKSTGLVEDQFTINASPEAFSILSGKLYTDIVKAIVRELSTNAYDSHVAAGNKEKPFDLHLPSTPETYFSIRDYGTGLTPEEVKEIYSTYFKSNRNKSNDFMGCFGLGSKTPFGLVDTFNVTSYKDGTVYHYCLFKNEKNIPALTLLHSEPTQEPNGVLIKIDNIFDYGVRLKFLTAASEIFEFFKIRPNFLGIEAPDYTERKIVKYVDNIVICESDFEESLYIVMGQIPYKFNTKYVKNPFKGNVFLHVNIGDCSVPPSREEILYDKKTIDFVSSKLNAALTDLYAELEKENAKYSNNLDKFYGTLQLSEILRRDNAQDIKNICFENKVLTYGNHNNRSSFIETRYYDIPGNKPILILKDCDLEPKNKRKIQYLSTKDPGRVYWLLQKEIPEFGPVDLKLSGLPDAPRKARDESIIRNYVKLIKSSGWLVTVSEIEKEELNPCAVRKVHNKIILNGHGFDSKTIKDLAQIMGYNRVYAISKSHFKKLSVGLVDLEKEVKNYLENFIKNLDTNKLGAIYYEIPYYVTPLKDLNDEFKELYNISQNKVTNEQEITFLNNIALSLGYKIPEIKNPYEELGKKYPLLSNLGLTVLNNDKIIEEIKIYIDAKCRILSQNPG